MDSLMDTHLGRQTNQKAGLIPFSVPTYAQVQRAFGNLVLAMYRLDVVGADHLPVTGPVVIAPNHDSVLDGIILGAAISRELRFLARAELWRSRLLAWVLDGLSLEGVIYKTKTLTFDVTIDDFVLLAIVCERSGKLNAL